MHKLAVFGSHAVQLPPPTPQALGVGGVVQAFELQQPVGHEVASQTQAVPVQCRPGEHVGPVPQAQPPFTQALAVTGSQATHAPPFLPQVDGLAGLQVMPEQQPPGQLAAQPLQTPAVQVSPLPHGVQAAPPEPHCAGVVAVTQTFPAQQPIHDRPSHLQLPRSHRCPAGQAKPMPHMQPPAPQVSAVKRLHGWHAAPPVPQLVIEVEVRQVVPAQQVAHEVASQTHWPDAQRWPAAQGTCVPQAQPFGPQRSAVVALQATQAAPPLPHAATVFGVTHLPLESQQPSGQLDTQETPTPESEPPSPASANVSMTLPLQPTSRARQGRTAKRNRAMGSPFKIVDRPKAVAWSGERYMYHDHDYNDPRASGE